MKLTRHLPPPLETLDEVRNVARGDLMAEKMGMLVRSPASGVVVLVELLVSRLGGKEVMVAVAMEIK